MWKMLFHCTDKVDIMVEIKTLMKKFLFLAIFFSLFSLSVSQTFASTFRADQYIQLTEISNDDLYLTGDDVVIDKDVHGDLFVAAGKVVINANIYGDLFATAGSVIINGKVADDARIIAGQVNIKNNIGSDLMVTSGNLEIDQNVLISGDLNAAVGLLKLAGQVGQDVEAASLDLQFSGIVKGNANFVVDKNANIANTALIEGNLSYYAIQKANFPREVVKGEIKFNELKGKDGFLAQLKSQFNSGRIIFNVVSYFSFLLVVGILIMISPKYVWAGVEEIKKNFAKTLLIGVVGALAVLLGSILLMVTVIGIPLGIIALVLGLISLYLGRVAAVVWLGNLLLKTKKVKNKWTTFGVAALGSAFYWILSLIPFYLGFFFSLLFAFLGFGAILKVKHNYFKQLRKNNLI